MPDYQKGKIYKIISDQTDKMYFGATVQKYLCERFRGHKKDMKKGKYCSSKEILVFDDAQIVLIENFPCNSKNELAARERHFIELNKDVCVNIQVPGRTIKEYNQTQKVKDKEKARGKVRNNLRRLIKYDCECGTLQVTKCQKNRHNKSQKHQEWADHQNWLNAK